MPRTRSGFREDDADLLGDLHNLVVQRIIAAAKAGDRFDEAAAARRLCALGAQLIASAGLAFGRDFEGEALTAIDADLRRVQEDHARGGGDGEF